MKKILLVILMFSALAACATQADYPYVQAEIFYIQTELESESPVVIQSNSIPMGSSFEYLTFEEALVGAAADVVIAQYVGHRLFGQNSLEFEFIVSERILGDAADRIFVYIQGMEIGDFGRPVFTSGTDYLLPLRRITRPYTTAHVDGFMFIRNMIINLDNPLSSLMYNEPLYLHSSVLNFNERSFSRQEIIAHVTTVTTDNVVLDDIIRSEAMEDIVLGSPYVLVVEISRLGRLDPGNSDLWRHDIFYATVLSILEGEGDISVGDEIDVTFHVNTVDIGEQHVIAVNLHSEGWFDFTSRNSLFSTDQLPEILTILDIPISIVITVEDDATATQSSDTLQFNAAVAPADVPLAVEWSVTGHSGVTMDENGLLTVAANVPANTTLTVTATVAGTEISDSMDIVVTAAPGSGGGWWQGPHIPAVPQQQPPIPPVEEDNEDIDPQIRLQLIFTAGQVEFLFHGMPRTAVGAPFLDPATDRMMVPLRTVAESTGVEVRWDYDTRSAVIYLPDEIIIILVDQPLPDGMGSAMLVNDRTFVPLRFVMEAFGADAQWYEPNLQAIISWYH